MNDKPEKQSRAGFSKGDADVWREFLERLLPQIYAMFIKRWRNTSLAEELVQKTVFDAVRGLSSYDPQKASPRQWIYSIARIILSNFLATAIIAIFLRCFCPAITRS